MIDPHGSLVPSPPTHSAIGAAIRLLADDQVHIADAARDCLRQYGERARPQLEEAAEGDEPVVRVRARALLRALEARCTLHRLLGIDLARGERRKPEPLLAGAVTAAQMVRTFTPEAAQLARRLRREGRMLGARFHGRSLATCARMLSEHLAGTLGFTGSERARDLEHVLLDRVLAHRAGVPVSLSLVWLLVGRWAGLSVSGVGMPEHFLVRLHGTRPVLVDPFHGGRSVTKIDCIRYLRSRGYEQVRGHLRDLSDREFLAAYLRQLRRAAARGAGDTQETLRDAQFHLEAD